MEPNWDRIQHYQAALNDVCETVNNELEQNRQKRDVWNDWTAGWKQIWAPWLNRPEIERPNDQK